MGANLGSATLFLNADPRELNKALGRVNKRIKRNFGEILSLGRKVGQAMTVAGVGIVTALGAATAEAATFQKGLAEVNTLGVRDIGALETAIKDVSVVFGLDLTDAVNATYQAISAGADETQIPLLLEKSAMAAAAGVTQLSTAVELGTSVTNAFGGEIQDVEQIFDEAFIAVRNGVTTFEELSSTVGKAAPLFAAAGLESRDLFASVAALTKGGIATAEAVTGVRAAVKAVIKPSKDMAKAFEEAGGPMRVMQELGFEGFLRRVAELTGGNVEEMAKLFPEVEGLNAVLALTGEQAGSFTQILGDMRTEAGAMATAFARFREIDPQAFDQMKSTLQVLAVEVGEVLLPTLNDLLQTAKPIIQQTLEWLQANEGVSKAIVLTAGAVGVFMVTVGPLLITLPGLVTLFGGLKTAIGFVAGAIGIGGAGAGLTGAVTGLATVLGPAVLGAAVIAAGISLKNLWDAVLELNDADLKLIRTQKNMNFVNQQLRQAIEERGGAIDETVLKGKSEEEQMDILRAKLKEVTDGQFGAAKATREAASATGGAASKTEALAAAAGQATAALHETTPASMDYGFATAEAQPAVDALSRLTYQLGQNGYFAAAGMREAAEAARELAAAQAQGLASGGVVGYAKGGTIPGFAGGGVPKHRIVMVGERGPEVAAFPVGTRVLSHADLMTAVRQGVRARAVPDRAPARAAGGEIHVVERDSSIHLNIERFEGTKANMEELARELSIIHGRNQRDTFRTRGLTVGN